MPMDMTADAYEYDCLLREVEIMVVDESLTHSMKKLSKDISSSVTIDSGFKNAS